MPRIKRWFPVNHNINRDPEVWAMRRQIGEKALSVWLEFLSIGDQNEGQVPGDYQALIRSVSGTCQATVRTVSAVYQWAISHVWLASEPTLHIVKYWNYHRSREPIKPLLGSLPSEPSEPSEPIKIKNKKSQPPGFAEFWTAYPIKSGKGQAEKAWIKQQPPLDEVLAAVESQKRWRANGNGAFRPEWKHPATWLNGKCWNDEPELPAQSPPVRLAPVKPMEYCSEEERLKNKHRLRTLIQGIGK